MPKYFSTCLNPLNLYVTHCAPSALLNQGRPLLKRCGSLSPAPHAHSGVWVWGRSMDAFGVPGKWGAASVCVWSFISRDLSAKSGA